MTKQTEILLKEYKKEFANYKSYIDKNTWVFEKDSPEVIDYKKLNTELAIVETIIKSTKKFKDEVGDDLRYKSVINFINDTVKIVNTHLSRIDDYKKKNPLNGDTTESEVKFQAELFSKKATAKAEISKITMDVDENSNKSVNLFYKDDKAPLLMREFLCNIDPVVKERTDSLGIDFKNIKSLDPSKSNEMFINMKDSDIPPWDESKHFFEQEKSTIQFWENEIYKIKNGITVGGYFIHPWLYWHLNFFKLSFGSGIGKKSKNPTFRDNEYFFAEMLKKAEDDGRKGLLMYGSRRISKSVTMASHLQLSSLKIPNAKCTAMGFSFDPDLLEIVNYMSESRINLHPALRIGGNKEEHGVRTILGLKKTAQTRYDYSLIKYTNLNENSKSGTQKGAASTPDGFIFDEIGKGACIKPWLAAVPSFADSERGGLWRTVPLLSGTAGNGALSADAEKMLKDPNMYELISMDWDMLEEKVDPEYRTWTRQAFSYFVPAQLSIVGPEKTKSNLADYLKIDSEELKLIKIDITDWKISKEFYENKMKELDKDIERLTSFCNSHPTKVDHCYLTSEINKFPGLEAKKRRKFIEEQGLQGQKVWLLKTGDKIIAEQTNDQLVTEYPYKGGNINAPIVILDDPYNDSDIPPPLGLYCIGFDDVKQEKSSGDSVMSATVFKRSYEGGEWSNRIVAYYDSRPPTKREYYKNLYLLIKFYNARILHENEDNGFVEYMEEFHMDDVYAHLSDGVGLATEDNLNRNKNRRFGWSPTPQNIYNLEQTIVAYTKEENVVIGDEQDLTGIDRINHPLLLEELYQYKKGLNADRIRSFGLALKLARYYDKTFSYIKNRSKAKKNDKYTPRNKKITNLRGFTDTSKLVKY